MEGEPFNDNDFQAAVGSFANFDFFTSDLCLAKSLSNQGVYAGKTLTTKCAVPGNIHKEEFRDFWLNFTEC